MDRYSPTRGCLGVLATVLMTACASAARADAGDSVAASAWRPSLAYEGSAFANLRGGQRTGATFTSNLNLQWNVDGSALLGWTDTTAYADILWLQGGLPSNFVGDAQGVSNISAPNSVKLYEAWIQKNFLADNVSVLAGLYDLNSEFYRLQSAGLFLNSSFGIGPEFALSGSEGPSIFPDTALGLRLAFKWREGLIVRVAVLDGVPVDRPDGNHGAFRPGDGALLVAEVAWLDRPPASDQPASSRLRLGRRAMYGNYDSKVAIGAWYYTANFDDLSATEPDGQPVRHRGSGGVYAIVDHALYQDPSRPERKLMAFLQAGLGDGDVNRFGSYFGSGLSLSGPFNGRPADQFGVAIAYARNGSHYMRSQQSLGLPVTNAETTVELSYLIQVTPWLALQPDLQYVNSPNTSPELANALAVQLRIAMSF